jgi:protein-disulfide isomerase
VISLAVVFAVSLGVILALSNNTSSAASNQQLDILSILPSDPVLGSTDAPVTIFEYGDFQCPSCGHWFKTQEPQIVRNLIETGKAKLVWRDFAFYGQDSTLAAIAARVAGEQGKFWDFHNILYSNQGAPNDGWASERNLRDFAQRLGLNMNDFDQVLHSGKYDSLIKSNFDKGRQLNANGTPTFFVVGPTGNVVKIEGGQPYSVFESVVNSLIRG